MSMDLTSKRENQAEASNTNVQAESDCSSNHTLRFGWGPISGNCLQIFNKPIFFLICSTLAVFGEGFVVVGIALGAITSMETQFGYSSAEVAMFAVAYEAATGIMSVVLGYFGGIHKPRCISFSLVLLAGGAVLVAVPKFVMGTYTAAIERTSDFCVANTTSAATIQMLQETCHGVEPAHYKVIFFIGFILMGFGAVPLWTLIPSHLEEVTERRKSSIYMAIYYCCNALGPAIGFLVAKPILSKWVDINKHTSLNPMDKNWVGAWWLGFLLGAGILLLPVIPLAAFPKEFPNTHILRKKRAEAEDCAAMDTSLKSDIKSVWPAFRALLTNPSYMFVTLGITLESLATGGFSAFFAKSVHLRFHVTEGQAALYTGAMIIPGAVLGTLLGGYLVSRYDWNCRQILKFCSAVAFFAALAVCFLLVGCDEHTGVEEMVKNDLVDISGLSDNLTNSCNHGCGCTTQFYKPICSVEDQKTYYSPCHAGCLKSRIVGPRRQVYFNCSCFPSNVTQATRGACVNKCNLLPVFAIGCVVIMLITWSNNIPLIQATLRLSNAGQGPFALGFAQVFIRFLGFVPGPFMFGSLIDRSCVLWQKDICRKETRNCLEYNRINYRNNMFAGGITAKMLSFVFIFLAYKTYRLPVKTPNKSKALEGYDHTPDPDIAL